MTVDAVVGGRSRAARASSKTAAGGLRGRRARGHGPRRRRIAGRARGAGETPQRHFSSAATIAAVYRQVSLLLLLLLLSVDISIV